MPFSNSKSKSTSEISRPDYQLGALKRGLKVQIGNIPHIHTFIVCYTAHWNDGSFSKKIQIYPLSIYLQKYLKADEFTENILKYACNRFMKSLMQLYFNPYILYGFSTGMSYGRHS